MIGRKTRDVYVLNMFKQLVITTTTWQIIPLYVDYKVQYYDALESIWELMIMRGWVAKHGPQLLLSALSFCGYKITVINILP